MTNNTSIVIVGGSMVGLALAALLAKENFSVTVIESKPYHFSENKLSARVSAIHLTSAKLFHYLGVWDALEKTAAPLQEMKIWDYTQNAQLHFDSRDINELQMGWIIDNEMITKVLYEKLKSDDHVTFLCPQKPTQLQRAENKIILSLENSHVIETPLLIGADGAHSWVREHMPVHLKKRSYFHKAIITVIQSQYPHQFCAYQKFLTTGPAALLPLKNPHHTALVWSADNAMSDELMQQSIEDFNHALTESLDFKLGKLTAISERMQFPLTMRHADNYVAENCALVGDAAHTIHPLAGLGVNLGLMDAACLADILCEARNKNRSIENYAVLRNYARKRKAENELIIIAMRGLKEIFEINTKLFNVTRSLGINTINDCAFIKNKLMQLATGQSDELPDFLQKNYFTVV